MPVESVKNSTHGSTSTHSVDTVGQNAPQSNNFGHTGVFNYGKPISGIGSLGLPDLTMQSLNLSMYGPIALNQRAFGAYKQQMIQKSFDYEGQNIAEDNKKNLEPLAERIGEFRILGRRIIRNDEETETLEEAAKAGKGVALYLTYAAQDGLKNPNLPVSFKNLKNPLKTADHLKHQSLIAEDPNENINILSDVAINERSPELAACLLKETSKGGILRFGADYQTAKKLLVDSESKFDNKADYYNFVTGVDKAYKEQFPGKSLDKYIKDNFKPAWQESAPLSGIAAGAMAGLVAGGLIGAAIGAVAGGLLGSGVRSSHWFGLKEEGEHLLKVVDKARQNDNDVDPDRYSFGSLSGTMGIGSVRKHSPAF